MTDYTSFSSKASELIVFRSILDDNIIKKLLTLLENRSDTSLIYEYTAEIVNKAEQLGLSGNILNGYINYLISQDENIFSIMTEKTGGKLGNSLIEAVTHDMAILKELMKINLSDLVPLELLNTYQPTFAADIFSFSLLQKQVIDAVGRDCSPNELVEILLSYYSAYGYGDMANFKAFRWQNDSGLEGIKHFDSITLTDIVGYERQKETLVKNTEAFLNNKPANNVLLIGARGTGKSSSVKALANNYFTQGLRLVEINKQQMSFLPKIMEALRKRAGKKFVLFLDDLSFEEFEVEYKYLKSVIEGGVEAKPDNVLIYATSNRRHLIKETWNDRSGENDEIHRFDTVHEKISLSDRFGITITYLAPNQDEYLQIVEELARKNSIDIPFSELKKAAIKWELSHSGRSGRTAQQFINYIMGQ